MPKHLPLGCEVRDARNGQVGAFNSWVLMGSIGNRTRYAMCFTKGSNRRRFYVPERFAVKVLEPRAIKEKRLRRERLRTKEEQPNVATAAV